MSRFLIVLIGVAALIGGAFWLAQNQGLLSTLPSFLLQTLIFLVFGTVVIYQYLIRAKKPELFIQLYLFTMAVKLFAYGAYCWIMIVQDRVGAMMNVTFFMTLYVVFTGLEIGFLFRRISPTRGPE